MRVLRVLLDRRGQTLVVVALVMMVLVAMMALVLDGGHAYAQRRRMQNAADAGALAGARELALEGLVVDAEYLAEEYAVTHNGADDDPIVNISADLHEVEVITTKTFSTWFAALIGRPEVTVRARAVARWDVSGGGELAPIAVYRARLDAPPPPPWEPEPTGFEYIIWDSWKEPPGEGEAGANRGWLGLDCLAPSKCSPDANDLKHWMKDGYDGYLPTVWPEFFMGDDGTKTTVIDETSVGKTILVPLYDYVWNYSDSWKADRLGSDNDWVCTDPDFDTYPDDGYDVTEMSSKAIDPDQCICTEWSADNDQQDCENRVLLTEHTEDSGLNGKYYFEIRTFAGFLITNLVTSGSVKGIEGRWVSTVAPGEPGFPPPGGDYGVRVVRLID